MVAEMDRFQPLVRDGDLDVAAVVVRLGNRGIEDLPSKIG
jgi:hypothetical protein